MRRPSLAACAAALVIVVGWGISRLSAADAAIDKTFQDFWNAADQAGALKRVDAVVKSGVSFEEALTRLRRGRDYSPNAPRGQQQGRHRTFDGTEHAYTFVVPQNYDPSRPYQVRVQLHGGASRSDPPDVGRLGIDRLPGTLEEISVFPAGWVDSLWWQASQVDNLSKILDKLKRTYNVDENRVYLTGVSDGGTGVYFMAFRETTPWASFLPLIGNMTVLSTPEVGADGEIFPGNAVNKPFFVVNAGRDRLYPAHIVQPFVEHLQQLGADVVFHVQPDSDHNTTWWPKERAGYEEFVDAHPRDPLPDTLTWETERTDRYNRAHWLIIDRLGDATGQRNLADSNLLRRGLEYDFGLRINSNVERGRRAADVVATSNAYRIGLRAGDLILEVGGRQVQTARDILGEMQQWAVGSTVHLLVDRAGQRVSIEGPFEPDEVEAAPEPIFPRGKASGRVDLARHGNVVEASTHGVKAFTLLLSPSKFNFSQPVRVVANGRTVFDGPLKPSVATLLKWAARDNDRTMLFGAELTIDLTK
jgi:PDZ domain-containing protein